MNIQQYIERREREFEKLGKNGVAVFDLRPFLNLRIKATLLSELLFCISTANSRAISGLKFQKLLEGKDLKKFSFEDFVNALKVSGVRFYNIKANYMVDSIKNFDSVLKVLKKDDKKAREMLAEQIKGFGFKEASHFLRNVGRKNVAIIDRHVLHWLRKHGYINNTYKNLSKANYLRIENLLKDVAKKKKINLVKLDLMIWYEATGMVLK